MKIVITSLKYNIGHYSHLAAYYRLFEKLGFEPIFLIHKSYYKLDTNNDYQKISEKRIFKLESCNYLFIYSPSFKNIIIQILFKFFYKCKIVYVFHEPFDSVKTYLSSGFSRKRVAMLFLNHLYHKAVIKLTSIVILPSKSSMDAFGKRFSLYKKDKYQTSLIFNDELKEENENILNKKYISYIGTISADHAFSEYLNFAMYCAENGLLRGITFLIASKNFLDSEQMSKVSKYVESGNIKLLVGKPLMTEEINRCFAESAVVWNAYHRSMQSGVLPKAFMFKTPVIILRKNDNEFVEEGKTALLLNSNTDFIEISEAIKKIVENQVFYSENCRNSFIQYFFNESKTEEYKKIFKISDIETKSL
ncbi:MAG: glycosyltransferase [Bacteroidota bacterium]|nr:glycosyltransferase [Bacteroidota bacterium]